jgi:hypothetical protein
MLKVRNESESNFKLTNPETNYLKKYSSDIEEHIPENKYLNKQSSIHKCTLLEGKHSCFKTMILNPAH